MGILNKKKIKDNIKQKKLDSYQEEIIKELDKIVNDKFNRIIKKYRNKIRLNKIDEKKEHIKFVDYYKGIDVETLPSWIIDDLENVKVVGKSKKVLKDSGGRKYHMDNKLNHLSGGEWTYFLCSVINTRYSTKGQEGFAYNIRKIHPTPKPPILMKDIISFFTKENEIVLDYFMGVGGTLLGSSICNRRAVGIDINSEYIDAYKKTSEKLNLNIQPTIQGDSIEILKNKKNLIEDIIGEEKVSLILLDPPYGNMMSRKKTGESKNKNNSSSATPFSCSDKDLGNVDIEFFHTYFKESVKNALDLLKNNGHLVVFIKDLQPEKKELNLLHAAADN